MLAVETGRGVVCGLLVVRLFGAARLRFEVRDGFGVGKSFVCCSYLGAAVSTDCRLG